MELLAEYTRYRKVLHATEELAMSQRLQYDELKRIMNQRAYYLKELNRVYNKLMVDKQEFIKPISKDARDIVTGTISADTIQNAIFKGHTQQIKVTPNYDLNELTIQERLKHIGNEVAKNIGKY